MAKCSQHVAASRLTPAIIIALVMGLFAIGLGGCTPSNTDGVVTTERELTKTDRQRREKVLAEIRGQSRESYETLLVGPVTAEHEELFSLADGSSVKGTERTYFFVFRTDSPADPKRFQEGDAWLTIYVKSDSVVDVNYDVLVR